MTATKNSGVDEGRTYGHNTHVRAVAIAIELSGVATRRTRGLIYRLIGPRPGGLQLPDGFRARLRPGSDPSYRDRNELW
jgi:hypothetical protein